MEETHLVSIVIIDLLVGVGTGWLAAAIAGTRGCDFWGTIALGVLGASAGPTFFEVIDPDAVGLVAITIEATVGAMIVLTIAQQRPV